MAGCERSGRRRLDVIGPAHRATGLACPRHATHTELGALLLGWTVEATRR